MVEYLTQAIVLSSRPQKENDRLADLYTKEFGRMEAKVIGGRKILSKLAPHLDLFNVVTVRLVEKNRITVTDALTDERFEKERRDPEFYPLAFKIFSLVRALAPVAVPDARLWHYLLKSLRNRDGNARTVLKIFGYDPAHASCDACDGRPVKAFRAKDQSFFCEACGWNARADELIYL
jgi:DNA repair protein RecO